METNHKELFDQVIGEETNEVPMDGSTEDKINAGCIPIQTCLGSTMYIDPNDPGNADLFAPENFMKHISGFSEMESSLVNVMHNLLRINEFEVKDRGDYIKHLIEQFSQSLTGYGIDPKKYDELNEALSPYVKAMFMCFDLFAFAKTINHYLVSMAQAQMMATGGLSSILPSESFTSDDVFAPGEVDLPTEGKYEENKCYKVYGRIQPDNRVEILQVIEGDTSPDDMLIVHDEEDDELEGVISLYTINKTEEEAVINAKIVFEGYIRDMLETDADRALRIAEEMNSSSGLIS